MDRRSGQAPDPVASESLAENAPDILARFDRSFRHVYVNPAVERVTNLPREAFIGKTNRDLGMPEALVARWDDALRQVFDTGRSAILEFEFDGSGDRAVYESHLVPEADEDGAVATVLCITRDVTERYEMQETFRALERRLTQVLESIHEGFFAVDRKDCFTYVNHQAEHLLRREPGELLGRNLWEAFPQAVGLPFHEQFQRAVREHAAASFEAYYPPMEKWFNVSVYPFAEGASVYFQDVTKRRQLQEELARVSEAERAHLGQVLHDGIRGHLTGIAMACQGTAEALRTGRRVEPEMLEEIARMAVEGAEMTRSLAQGLHPIHLNGQSLLAALQELTAYAWSAARISCTFDGPEALPKLDAGVHRHLYWIAREALNNALKHAAARHIRIGLATGDGRLVLTVADDGHGLPEPVAHSDGMGLHLMQYRAEMIGALLEIDVPERGGTRVTCLLPLWRKRNRKPVRLETS